MTFFGKSIFQAMTRMGMRWMLSAALLAGTLLSTAAPVQASPWVTIPTFTIVSVAADSTVTIQTANFPANETFTIRMGEYGTLGINGVVVGTTESGGGGSFQATYTIPDSLKGKGMIAIRMDNASGYYYSYNWFYNSPSAAATATPSGGGPAVPPPPYLSVVPTFTISSVVRDNTVVIHTSNYPANETFTVRMGAYGSYAINGVVVATTESGGGGAFEATYTIPDSLKGLDRIAIRLDSSTGYYYSYNWFYNNSTN